MSLDYKNWVRGWRFEKDAPWDEEWQKDRSKLFMINGNGWWWGWTEHNCPIEDLKPHLRNLYQSRETERKKEIDDRCDS